VLNRLGTLRLQMATLRDTARGDSPRHEAEGAGSPRPEPAKLTAAKRSRVERRPGFQLLLEAPDLVAAAKADCRRRMSAIRDSSLVEGLELVDEGEVTDLERCASRLATTRPWPTSLTFASEAAAEPGKPGWLRQIVRDSEKRGRGRSEPRTCTESCRPRRTTRPPLEVRKKAEAARFGSPADGCPVAVRMK